MQGFRRIKEFSDYSGVVVEEIESGPSEESDADVLIWFQNNAGLIYHASATFEWWSSLPTSIVSLSPLSPHFLSSLSCLLCREVWFSSQLTGTA